MLTLHPKGFHKLSDCRSIIRLTHRMADGSHVSSLPMPGDRTHRPATGFFATEAFYEFVIRLCTFTQSLVYRIIIINPSTGLANGGNEERRYRYPPPVRYVVFC
ncbi:hypothetical protein DPMN_088191 [Dreissena polymorpha]|uniref:Uncharacterized protein n=1 Tax=Dreissena polymorpha TaxID=45954 RepID=A0A9D4KU34_DREPO|nr:hypothetical protein DPMN_088191 [Dreissena polymorpha]